MKWIKQAMKGVLRWLRLHPESNDKLYEGLNVGPNTYFIRQNLDGMAPLLITIGRDCVLAPTAIILTHDASTFVHTGKYRFAPVKIGNRCFLGYNSVIMPGITLGDDVIVGAGAVVTGNVPSGVTVGGVPARVIGKTMESIKTWQHQLIEPPYRFGEVPTLDHLIKLQTKVLAKYSNMTESDSRTMHDQKDT